VGSAEVGRDVAAANASTRVAVETVGLLT